jgi:hypothetical protein
MSNNIFSISSLALSLRSYCLSMLCLGASLVSGEPIPTTSTIYFKANGTQLFGTWTSQKTSQLQIPTIGFEQFILPHAEPTRSENGQVKTYKVKSREVEMVIEITDKLCENQIHASVFVFSNPECKKN